MSEEERGEEKKLNEKSCSPFTCGSDIIHHHTVCIMCNSLSGHTAIVPRYVVFAVCNALIVMIIRRRIKRRIRRRLLHILALI